MSDNQTCFGGDFISFLNSTHPNSLRVRGSNIIICIFCKQVDLKNLDQLGMRLQNPTKHAILANKSPPRKPKRGFIIQVPTETLGGAGASQCITIYMYIYSYIIRVESSTIITYTHLPEIQTFFFPERPKRSQGLAMYIRLNRSPPGVFFQEKWAAVSPFCEDRLIKNQNVCNHENCILQMHLLVNGNMFFFFFESD